MKKEGRYYDSIPNLDRHLAQIGRPGVWMDEPDILAASYSLNTNIIVHRLNESPRHYHRSANAPTIELAYVNGNHYDSVRPAAPWQLVTSRHSTRRSPHPSPPSSPPPTNRFASLFNPPSPPHPPLPPPLPQTGSPGWSTLPPPPHPPLSPLLPPPLPPPLPKTGPT